jgi:hypothetical protein
MEDRDGGDIPPDIGGISSVCDPPETGKKRKLNEITIVEETSPAQSSSSSTSSVQYLSSTSSSVQSLSSTTSPAQTSNDNSSPAQNTSPTQIEYFYSRDVPGPYVVFVQNADNTYLHPLKFGNFLFKNSSLSKKPISIKPENRFKISVTFDNYISANEFVKSSFVKENKLKAFVPSYKVIKSGLVRDIPLEMTESDIIENATTNGSVKIMKVRRLNRKEINKETKVLQWVASTTCIVTFRGQILPKNIYLFYNSLPVELYSEPTIICHICARFGHLRKNCRSKPRCAICSSTEHSKDTCTSEEVKCPNCDGDHSALHSSCPELKRQRDIKKIMATDSLSFAQAVKMFPKSRKPYSEVVQPSEGNIPSEHAPVNNPSFSSRRVISSTKSYSAPLKKVSPLYNDKSYKENLSYTNGQAGNLSPGCALSTPDSLTLSSSDSENTNDHTSFLNNVNLNTSSDETNSLKSALELLLDIIFNKSDTFISKIFPLIKLILDKKDLQNK